MYKYWHIIMYTFLNIIYLASDHTWTYNDNIRTLFLHEYFPYIVTLLLNNSSKMNKIDTIISSFYDILAIREYYSVL